jgi:hypothetical protein
MGSAERLMAHWGRKVPGPRLPRSYGLSRLCLLIRERSYVQMAATKLSLANRKFVPPVQILRMISFLVGEVSCNTSDDVQGRAVAIILGRSAGNIDAHMIDKPRMM